MGDLVNTIARALVSKPEEVTVTTEQVGNETVIRLKVDKDDMGKVIGKQGRIAKAIRTVVRAAAVKQNIVVSVDIVED